MTKRTIEAILRGAYLIGAVLFLLSGVVGCHVKAKNLEHVGMIIGLALFLLSFAALAIWFPRGKPESDE